ncbi:hypothetical protein FIBSPDRAFT_698943, partial [Athelia psychrophila]
LDNGELKSACSDAFFASKGIKAQWTALQTSAHNGRCERIHCTLANSARSM